MIIYQSEDRWKTVSFLNYKIIIMSHLSLNWAQFLVDVLLKATQLVYDRLLKDLILSAEPWVRAILSKRGVSTLISLYDLTALITALQVLSDEEVVSTLVILVSSLQWQYKLIFHNDLGKFLIHSSLLLLLHLCIGVWNDSDKKV